jgi:hypothetical protein
MSVLAGAAAMDPARAVPLLMKEATPFLFHSGLAVSRGAKRTRLIAGPNVQSCPNALSGPQECCQALSALAGAHEKSAAQSATEPTERWRDGPNPDFCVIASREVPRVAREASSRQRHLLGALAFALSFDFTSIFEAF